MPRTAPQHCGTGLPSLPCPFTSLLPSRCLGLQPALQGVDSTLASLPKGTQLRARRGQHEPGVEYTGARHLSSVGLVRGEGMPCVDLWG